MKLKYYLRGMGIGIILTAIVMGFALGGRKATLSDAEIIQRAKALGMVDGDSGVLLDSQDQEGEETTDDTSASSTPLFEEGAKIPEKEQQEIAGTGSSVAEVAEEEEEGKDATSEASKDKSGDIASSAKEASTTSQSGKTSVTEESSSLATEASAAASSSTSIASTSSSAAEASTADQANASSGPETSDSATDTGINKSSKTITIPGGLGSDQVAQILAREGIIDNAVSFNKYLVDSRKDRVIRSGVKTIPAGATYEQIASIITK
jgi:hypothetical protein